MSKYLCQTTEVYHVNTEEQAKQAIENAQSSNQYQLTKHSCEYKEIKSKGEVIDTYYKLTLVKQFNDIKNPESNVSVTYEVEPGYFPD